MDSAALLTQCSNHFKQVITAAFHAAALQGTKVITPLHVLLACSQERGAIAAEILRRINLSEKILHQAVTDSEIITFQNTFTLSTNAKRAIQKAVERAARDGHPYVGTEHLLYGLLAIESADINFILSAAGVPRKTLEQQIAVALKSAGKLGEMLDTVRASTAVTKTAGHRPLKTPALDFFGRELTAPHIADNIDPVIGRETEIERLIHILGRRTKNNPLLLGEPGVGKTAIVEGLAKRILEGQVPPALLNKKIFAVDLGLMIAGTMYRGEFEGRIKALVEEVKNNPDIILFIDEVHSLVGAGSSQGNLDAANLLKPALARGELRVIGATTFAEFKKHIEHDAALERRFQPLQIREPSAAETEEILRHTKTHYEKFHGVKLADTAIPAAVQLAHKYFPEKFFPDKALDLLDETMSALKIQRAASGEAEEHARYKKELRALLAAKTTAIQKEDYELAAGLRTKELVLQEKITQLATRPHTHSPVVSAAEIEAAVERIIGRPLSTRAGVEQPPPIYQFLSDHLHGQDAALAAVSAALTKAQLGLQAADRPLASFLFVGSSGVGKTELAKLIAAAIYQDPKALIRIDMTEFSESHSVSKLLGSPAGYVGFRESVTLVDRLRRQPLSVLLFDEIDKAHPEVINILLQMLDEGRLTDASGKEASVRQCVIVLTHQVPLAEIQGSDLGFVNPGNIPDPTRLRQSLNRVIRPELLNRLDDVIIFLPLLPTTLALIATDQLQNLRARLVEKGLELSWEPAVIDTVARLAYAPDEGARRVRQVLEQQIERRLVENFSQHPEEKTYHCCVKNDIISLQPTRGGLLPTLRSKMRGRRRVLSV